MNSSATDFGGLASNLKACTQNYALSLQRVFLTHGFETLCNIFVLHVYCILHWDKDKEKSLPVVFWFSLGCIKTVHITPVFLYFIYELQYQGRILMDK